jgi:hypothetical protein
MFCILLPVCMSPALVVLFIGDHRAKKLGVEAKLRQQIDQSQLAEDKVHRTLWGSTQYYFMRLNVVGLLLMGFGFALLLTPITLSTTAKGGYKNRESSCRKSWGHGLTLTLPASLIAMLVIGGILFIGWCVWDGFFATYPFMPHRVFNRTFVSHSSQWEVGCGKSNTQVACVAIDFFYYSSSYLIDTYFTSWVYVIVDWPVSARYLD